MSPDEFYVPIRRSGGSLPGNPLRDAGGTQKAAELCAAGAATHAERSAPRLARAPAAVPLLGGFLGAQCARMAESGGGTQP